MSKTDYARLKLFRTEFEDRVRKVSRFLSSGDIWTAKEIGEPFVITCGNEDDEEADNPCCGTCKSVETTEGSEVYSGVMSKEMASEYQELVSKAWAAGYAMADFYEEMRLKYSAPKPKFVNTILQAITQHFIPNKIKATTGAK